MRARVSSTPGPVLPHALPLALCVLGGVALLGCEEDDSGGDFSGPDGSAAPASGVWDYRDEGVEENTCTDAVDLTRDPDTSFRLEDNGDGTFTVDQGQAGPPFDCTLGADNRFSCPSRLFDMSEVDQLDATITWNVSVAGEFTADDRMRGTQRVDVSCEGPGCALAPSLGVTVPCYYTVAFRANRR